MTLASGKEYSTKNYLCCDVLLALDTFLNRRAIHHALLPSRVGAELLHWMSAAGTPAIKNQRVKSDPRVAWRKTLKCLSKQARILLAELCEALPGLCCRPGKVFWHYIVGRPDRAWFTVA